VEFPARQPTAKGPAEWFTGDVWIDAIARGEEPHFMAHLSITEATGGQRPEADWGEHVTDDEYGSR
jgi:hypothetical protein